MTIEERNQSPNRCLVRDSKRTRLYQTSAQRSTAKWHLYAVLSAPNGSSVNCAATRGTEDEASCAAARHRRGLRRARETRRHQAALWVRMSLQLSKGCNETLEVRKPSGRARKDVTLPTGGGQGLWTRYNSSRDDNLWDYEGLIAACQGSAEHL